jgi:Predicted membrane protein
MSFNEEKRDLEKIATMEVVISNYLRIGVAVSAIIIFAGLLMFFIIGHGGYPAGHFPSSIRSIMKGLLVLKPDAIILAGLSLLILTPIFRVGVSIVLFYKEKDYLYVVITSLVFIILLLGLFLGKVSGN